jgi:hypothetical protein
VARNSRQDLFSFGSVSEMWLSRGGSQSCSSGEIESMRLLGEDPASLAGKEFFALDGVRPVIKLHRRRQKWGKYSSSRISRLLVVRATARVDDC